MSYVRFIDKDVRVVTAKGEVDGKFLQEHKDFIEIQYKGAERFIFKTAIIEIYFLKTNEVINGTPTF